jgi:hypothetical protein
VFLTAAGLFKTFGAFGAFATLPFALGLFFGSFVFGVDFAFGTAFFPSPLGQASPKKRARLANEWDQKQIPKFC